jgi:hypothetical protein
VQCEFDLAARLDRPFRHQLRLDPTRMSQGWGEKQCQEEDQAVEHKPVIARSEATKQSSFATSGLPRYARNDD